MRSIRLTLGFIWRLTLVAVTPMAAQAEFVGYYSQPAVYQDTIVFCAEGDLWSVPTAGGVARRLTTHPGIEDHPVISPDGKTLAFTARYEGPAELYTMPLSGGLPVRRTYDGESAVATTFTPQGAPVYTTVHFSTLPDRQLVALDLQSGERQRIPLSQASEGSYDASGTLYFVRPAFHNNVTRHYTGGQARQIWKYKPGAQEAEPLTKASADGYKGENHTPMWWNGRVYFINDRDGTMNLWSMNEAGGDLRQHTHHRDFDSRFASLGQGRIVYVVGADLWLYDIASNADKKVPISLASDLDQLREKWVTKPMENLTSARLSPDGGAIVLTARGRVFVAPAESGRFVQASRLKGVRYRDAVFMPDGKSLLTLSDATGEFEFVQLPSNGVGAPRALTSDGKILRFEGVPSPNGKLIAYTDNNNDAWLFDLATRTQTLISTNREDVVDLTWSPDSRFVSIAQTARNSFVQLWLYDTVSHSRAALTSDRMNSRSVAWSPDGKWLYFLSDRNLQSAVGEPWGARQPEPFFDKPMKIYLLALQAGLRSPFKPADELQPAKAPEKDGEDSKTKDKNAKDKNAKSKPQPEPRKWPAIELNGIETRLYEVPAPAGNYRQLTVNGKALYWLSRDVGSDGKTHLMSLEIGNKNDLKPVRIAEDVRAYDLSRDGKKLLVRKEDALHVFDADVKAPSDFGKTKVDLSAWNYSLDEREDFKQLFIDAWRMERDYFYDPNMHGVDWNGVRAKYLPLVDRITTRAELSDLIGLAVGELSALHTSVGGGDLRRGSDDVGVPSLGARLVQDRAAGGYRIEYIYRSDPDFPNERAPLADPELGIHVGDVITHINGEPVLEAPHLNALLRNRVKQQVLVRIKTQNNASRDVIVTPIGSEFDLRYDDWEYTRRQRTERLSNNKIGYVHLQAMTSSDITSWYRNFYPVFDRQGLVVDARHNGGGNIESWILEKLMRRAWMYWQGRTGEPTPNMQYAFHGHMVVLVDENTGSDGEVFVEGFRRLGLGKVIGVRSWGGEIWLGSQNRLTDGGLARAPMNGVYSPEGKWLIEQHGVDPDIVVENLPHATFEGGDAQLDAAVAELLKEIERDPRPVPKAPPYKRLQ